MTLGMSFIVTSNTFKCLYKKVMYSFADETIFFFRWEEKNWNTQKQFRELDSVTFKLPFAKLFALLANLFPWQGACRTFVQVEMGMRLNSSYSLLEAKNCKKLFYLFWLFASNFSPSHVPGNIKNELLNAFFLHPLSLHHYSMTILLASHSLSITDLCFRFSFFLFVLALIFQSKKSEKEIKWALNKFICCWYIFLQNQHIADDDAEWWKNLKDKFSKKKQNVKKKLWKQLARCVEGWKALKIEC